MGCPGVRLTTSRAAFLAGGLAAAAGAVVPARTLGAAHASPGVAPQEALDLLMAGNKRFLAGKMIHDDGLAERREVLVAGQAPFASILACSDSRVPPNLVFDLGLGDLFIARVAGNYPDDLVVGSLEYALEHLGTRLIVVLGHEKCGAIKATYDAIEKKKPLPKHLDTIERLIRPGIMHVTLAHDGVEAATTANVRAAVATLQSTPPFISNAVGNGTVRVVGAEYRLRTGAVTLLD